MLLDSIDVTDVNCSNSTSKSLKEITSPNYEQESLSSQSWTCFWNLSTSIGEHVHLEFQYFDLHSHTKGDQGTCNYEYLEMYEPIDNRYRSTDKICGSNNLDNFTSSGKSLLLKFQSTGGLPKHRGFKAKYLSVTPGMLLYNNLNQNVNVFIK